MTHERILDTQRLVDIAKKHGIRYLALFGSHARGEARADSDVDLYACFGRHIGLFEMLAIKHEMEHALGLGVDLITEEVLDPYLFVRDGMAKDMVVLYEDISEVAASGSSVRLSPREVEVVE